MTDMVTDFHSHILPGIDDGSASVEESIAMLRLEAAQGVRHVIATPHFYARYDSPERFLLERDRAEEKLREAMEQQEDLPELSVGAEVAFFRGMCESEWLPLLTIRDRRSILIEMPAIPWTDAVYGELTGIWENFGIMPIIAHIDRYIGPFRTHGIPQRLAEMPVYVQASAEFFINRSTSGMALRMLKANQIHLLGSDCHNLSDRKPNLGAAMRRINRKLGQEAVDRIRGYEQVILDAENASTRYEME